MAVKTYKCPNCGGDLRFDPESQKFKCGYCFSEFTKDDLAKLDPQESTDQHIDVEEEPDFGDSAAGESEGAPGGAAGGAAGQQAGSGTYAGPAGQAETGAQTGTVLYTCPSCGAEIVTDATTVATTCYFCHNALVLEGKLRGEYLPDSMIPFKIDRKKAVDMFLDYVKSKKFVPRSFFSKEQIEKLTGVYYPYWVYSAQMEGGITARGTTVRVWVSGDTEFTDTSIYQVIRSGDVEVDNLTHDALKKSDHLLVNMVLPFRLKEKIPFDPSYLSGFVAERRDVKKEELSDRTRNLAREHAVSAMKNTIQGYTTVAVTDQNFSFRNEKWEYVLLPVWVLTAGGRDGGKYFFALNAQTGEVQGKLPVAFGKLAVWSLVIAAIVFVLAMLIQYLIF